MIAHFATNFLRGLLRNAFGWAVSVATTEKIYQDYEKWPRCPDIKIGSLLVAWLFWRNEQVRFVQRLLAP